LIGDSVAAGSHVKSKAIDCAIKDRNSTISTGTGYSAQSTSGATTDLALFRSSASGYAIGGSADTANASLLIAQSSFESTHTALAGSRVFSYGDNYLGGEPSLVNSIATR
jgi:hypothetical protein